VAGWKSFLTLATDGLALAGVEFRPDTTDTVYDPDG
jgi:hypothetical protein